MIRNIILFFFLFYLVEGRSQQVVHDRKSQIRVEIENIMNRLDVIGLAVVVVDKGQIIYRETNLSIHI